MHECVHASVGMCRAVAPNHGPLYYRGPPTTVPFVPAVRRPWVCVRYSVSYMLDVSMDGNMVNNTFQSGDILFII